MKVLTLSLWPISSHAIGGTERFILDFSQSMKSRGISTTVAFVSGESNMTSATPYISLGLEKNNKPFDEFSLRQTFFRDFSERNVMKFCTQVEHALPKEHWDVLHASSLLFCGVLPMVPKIFSLHTLPQEFDQIFGTNAFLRISSIIQMCTSKNTIFIAPSKFSVPIFQRAFQRKVITIPHCLNRERIITTEPRQNILKQFGLRNDVLIIANPSRIELTQKRQHLIIEALGRIKHCIPKFHVVFSGADMSYKKNIEILEKLAQKRNISLSFFALSHDDMAKFYRIADLIILPSRYESFGYTALESLSLGIKTIISDIPAFREIAKDNPHAHVWKESQEFLNQKIIEVMRVCNTPPVPQQWHNRYSCDIWGDTYVATLKRASI